MRSSLILLITILFFCCESENNCLNDESFSYDSSKGKCLNCNGEEGFNSLNMEQIRVSKSAECIDLSGIELVYLLDTANIENFSPSNQNIEGYNFRGCNFDNAILKFNWITNGNFEGADLTNLNYYYGTFEGKIDEFTKLPNSGNCTEINSDSIRCGS